MTEDKKTKQELTALVNAVQRYYGNWGSLIWRSFVGGIFTALGATVGFAVVIWIVGAVFTQLGVIPVIGDFFIRLNELIHIYSAPIA